jgi:hypothetical protein
MKVIEVTGEPCAGKSYFLRGMGSESDVQVFKGLARLSDEGSRLISLILVTTDFVRALWSNSIGWANILWLFKASMGIEDNIFVKLNVFRNCVLKFYTYQVLTFHRGDKYKWGNPVFVDEGISHIPFLFQNHRCKEVVLEEYFRRFSLVISTLNVFLICTSADTVERLVIRGHKRVSGRDIEYIRKFQARNRCISNFLKSKGDSFASFKVITDA